MENKGFSLFFDLEDKDLQAYNRARLMFNIMEDNVDKKTGKVSPKGGSLVMEYFGEIPVEDRTLVTKKLEELFKKAGINVS